MSAFFEKHGLGAGFDKRVSAARDLWRRDGIEAEEQGAPRGSRERSGSRSLQDYDGIGWIERLSREIGYERVERAFYLLMGGVIFAGCVAIVMAGFRGSQPAQPVEGVTEVRLATPPAPQETAAAPKENQNLSVAEAAPKAEAPAAAVPEQAQSVAPPAVATRDVSSAAPEIAPYAPAHAQSEPPSAETLASEMPPATETPREAEMAMAAPNAAEEAAPSAAEPEAAAPLARDTSADDADDKASGAERAANCFLKVSGRVIARGNCQLSRKGAAVTFLHSGQPVTLSPSRGREWSLTLGGRKIGTVYKVGGCWGSRRHTWICEKGA